MPKSSSLIQHTYEIMSTRTRTIHVRPNHDCIQTAEFVEAADALFNWKLQLTPEEMAEKEQHLLEMIAHTDIDKNARLSDGKTPLFTWIAINGSPNLIDAFMKHPDVDVNGATEDHNSLTALSLFANLRARRDSRNRNYYPFRAVSRISHPHTQAAFERLIGDTRVDVGHKATFTYSDPPILAQDKDVMDCLAMGDATREYGDHVRRLIEQRNAPKPG